MAEDTGKHVPTTPLSQQELAEQARALAVGKTDNSTAKRPENANLLPGGTQNTAGGQVKAVSAVDAAKTIKLEEFKEIHKKPCVRDALLTGMGSGFAMAGVRALMGGMRVPCSGSLQN
jgi:cytochrome c oxidase assembly protein subunit 20